MSNIIINSSDTIKIINREHWLTEFVGLFSPVIEEVTNKTTPDLRISVGFPSRGALSKKKRTIGQCWNGMSSADGAHSIFIHPQLVTPEEVSATVAHEMIHAHYPTDKHHGKFPATARAIGLTGKMTETVAGDEFINIVTPILNQLGAYPHVALKANSNHKPAPTRLLKVGCKVCGYTTRITNKWLDKFGAPFCPCNGVKDLYQMVEM